jgi:PAS domain S-box-containing protein
MVGSSDVPPVAPAAESSAGGLPASDDRYRTFLALSGTGIARFQMDPPVETTASEDQQVDQIVRQGRIAECNEVFASLYDRQAADLVGCTLPEFVPVEDPRRVEGVRQFVRSGYRLVDGEEVHASEDGSPRWVSGSALGVVEGDRLLSYWLTLTDVTDRRRAELDRELRGRILEAVAFGAARLLAPGRWEQQADAVLARLGAAAEVVRVYLAEHVPGPGDDSRLVFRFAWGAPGHELDLDDATVRGGWRLQHGGLARLARELQAGRPLVTLVRDLEEAARSLPTRMGSKSFAAVPIFSEGRWWGLLGFGETRFEREWSGPELEALKAAAAVFGAAIEREHADDALREGEERFERLAAAAFEGIAVTEGGVFVDANEQLARMLGYGVTDLIGREVQEFVAEEDRERVRARVTAGSEEPYQHLARRRDGSKFPAEVRARALPHRGRTVRVSAVRDVSERVQAEERQRRLEAELRQAADHWRQTFDALDLGIVLADTEGRIVRLNHGASAAAAGPGVRGAVGLRLDEMPKHEPWQSVLDLHRRVGETRGSVVAQTRDDSTGRSFYLLASPWSRTTGGAPWVVLTFRDVTDFTAIQEQLRRVRTMEAMGSLVAGVAHEVRNPLFSISATLDALEGEFGPRPEFTDYATLLRSQVGRLTQLMRDLLDYGKPSVLHRAPTRLGDVVRRAVRSCAPLARDRQVQVEVDIGADVPLLDVDGARLEQALQNLVANAVQHSPKGAAVRVTGSLDTTGPALRARCSVDDAGPGLPAENVARIFEPFFSRRKGGTGLGLSIVQRVAEAHGGDVTAENRPGAGARFTLLLPVVGTYGPTGGHDG